MGLLLYTSYIPNMSLRYLNPSLYNYHLYLWYKSIKKTINQYKVTRTYYKVIKVIKYIQ